MLRSPAKMTERSQNTGSFLDVNRCTHSLFLTSFQKRTIFSSRFSATNKLRSVASIFDLRPSRRPSQKAQPTLDLILLEGRDLASKPISSGTASEAKQSQQACSSTDPPFQMHVGAGPLNTAARSAFGPSPSSRNHCHMLAAEP